MGAGASVESLDDAKQVLKDELFLSHFSVARAVETMPEQAVLGFRAWCGAGLLACTWQVSCLFSN